MIWRRCSHRAALPDVAEADLIAFLSNWPDIASLRFMEWGTGQIKRRAVPLLRASAQCSFWFLLRRETTINNPRRLPVHSSGDGARCCSAELCCICISTCGLSVWRALLGNAFLFKKKKCDSGNLLCQSLTCCLTQHRERHWLDVKEEKEKPLQVKLKVFTADVEVNHSDELVKRECSGSHGDIGSPLLNKSSAAVLICWHSHNWFIFSC